MAKNALAGTYQNVKNALVPVNMRAFVSHLTGNRDPITERDLSPADIKALQFAISKQQNPEQGVIGYGDYSPKGLAGFDASQGPLDILYSSYTDPSYRMETTLGSAKYKRLPDGSYVITDKYDFNAKRKDVREALSNRNFLTLLNDAFRANGLPGVLNLIGNTYGSTEDEPGNPVRIQIPAK
jgi:hypothetical protein